MMQHSKGHYVHNTRITNIYSLGNYIIIAISLNRTIYLEDPSLTLAGFSWVKT